MRIAHICTKFSRVSETFIYDLVVGLERSATENHVLTAARVNAAERPFPRTRVLPVSLWRQAAFVIRKRWLNVYKFPLPRRAASAALQQIRPDVILAHFGGAGAAIAPVARDMGIPLAVVFHAFDLFMRPFSSPAYADLWASGARAIAVSEHGRRRLLDLGCPADRVRMIHCGVDASRFPPAPDRHPNGHGLSLVTIGRLVEKKGFDDLILAVASVQDRIKMPVRLDIWGEGPMKRRLEYLTRRLGLNAAVTLKGAVASQDVPLLLQHYNAFVLPSKRARNGDSEGIPITLLEAQAAGLPVVTTRHAGIPEAIPPQNHWLLAREGDARDLTGKLWLLCEQRNRWLEIGLCGREWVLKHFALENEITQYLQFFRELTSSSAAPAAMTIGGGI